MKAQLHSRSDIPRQRIDEMFQLISRHFAGVTRRQFLADLDEKNWVLLMLDEDSDHLAGFSTLDFQVTRFRGQTESVIYSGDTIMDPSAWNSSILSRAWIEAVHDLHRRFGRGPLWWLLITSGYRTYRLLPVFWRQFFPRCSGETPTEIQDRLTAFAQERFGSQFDPDTGIVCLPHPQRLREHLRGIPPARSSNRHIAFFNRANPGHLDGDELVCLTRLDDANLTPAGRRIVKAIRRQSVLCASR